MMYFGPKAFRRAIDELSKLPGIGEKTALRLVTHLVRSDDLYVGELSKSLAELKSGLRFCSNCAGLTDEELCPICKDDQRDRSLVCVVEEPADLFAVERSGHFKGTYHVLHGALAPLDGVGPERLKIRELLERVQAQSVLEVILATNPDVEGEATALYLAKHLGQRGVRVSRIALGLPMGGQLEYADNVTLSRAISERRQYSLHHNS